MLFQWSLFARCFGTNGHATILFCLVFLLKTLVADTLRLNQNLKISAVFVATEGGSISLRCPCAKNGTITSFAWLCPTHEYFSPFSQQLDHENSLRNNAEINDRSNNYKGIGRQKIVNGSLEISTVCGSDAGIYKCLSDSECEDCAICQATVELEVVRIGDEGDVDIPACSKEISSPERLHYSDWTYGALIFSAGLVLGLALAMFIVIFRRRSRKRFGSASGSRRSDFSFSKDSLIRCRSILERHKTASLRHTAHLLQKTRTISHRWMPMREESFQECQSIMTAFDDPAYGMYINPLRTRNSPHRSSIPIGPPPLPPRPRPKPRAKAIETDSGTASLTQIQEPSDDDDSDYDYEEADETALIKDGDLELVKLDNLEDSDGYVKMTIPSRPGSEMPSMGRGSAFHPNSSLLQDFAMALVTPASRIQSKVSYIELVPT